MERNGVGRENIFQLIAVRNAKEQQPEVKTIRGTCRICLSEESRQAYWYYIVIL